MDLDASIVVDDSLIPISPSSTSISSFDLKGGFFVSSILSKMLLSSPPLHCSMYFLNMDCNFTLSFLFAFLEANRAANLPSKSHCFDLMTNSVAFACLEFLYKLKLYQVKSVSDNI